MYVGAQFEVFEINWFSIHIFLLLWASSLPVLLYKPLHLFIRILKLLRLLIAKSLPHPSNEVPPEIADLPLFDIFHDVPPFMQILHGVKNGFVNVMMIAVGLDVEQLKQLFDGRLGVA